MAVDACIGTNTFNKAKYRTETETIANNILAILFGKPGSFPSMPHLGMHIQDTIYAFWDEINTNVIKAQLITQCGQFSDVVNDGEFDVYKASYKNQPLLVIVVPVQYQNKSSNLVVGVSQDGNGNTKYNFSFDDTKS